MIKMKKSAALILAGVLACSMPMPVMASSDTEVVESLLDSGIDFLASDPEKAVDIIMYAKDLVDQQNITDDQVRSAVTQAADHFGVSLGYLMGTEGEEPNAIDKENNPIVLDDEALELLEELKTRPEMRTLFSVSKKATKEDILKAVKIIEALKGDD